MSRKKKYWLMKTEPDVFSMQDLMKCNNQTEPWDGIRNYQARNLMRDEFQEGDSIFIYHSRIKKPAIVGIATVVREAYPDETAMDKNAKYFDAKSLDKGESRWVKVDVKGEEEIGPVTLEDMRTESKLEGMPLLQKGQRLSIQPVSEAQWQHVVKMAKKSPL